MGTTANGIVYPDASAVPKREAFVDLAESVDTLFESIAEPDSYTPSLGNWALGNGTLTGSYLQVRRLVWFRIRLVLGSTTSISASPTFTLPVTPTDPRAVIVPTICYDASAGAGSRYHGAWAFTDDSGTISVRTDASAAFSSTVPFSWTTDDEINICGTYLGV